MFGRLKKKEDGAYQIMRHAVDVTWDGTTNIFYPETVIC
jgi:hypothetical protein